MRKMKTDSIVQNKKGAKALNAVIVSAVTIILIVVVIFNIWSEVMPEVQTAGDKFNVSERCTAVGCFYNTTQNLQTTNDCKNNVSNTSIGCANNLGQGIPLSGLFKSSGIVVLLLMVFVLIIILRVVLKKDTK